MAPTRPASLVCVVVCPAEWATRHKGPDRQDRAVAFPTWLLSSVGSIAEATTCQTDGNAHSESHLRGSHQVGTQFFLLWGKIEDHKKSKSQKENGGLSCNSRHRSNGSRGWRNLGKPSPDLYYEIMTSPLHHHFRITENSNDQPPQLRFCGTMLLCYKKISKSTKDFGPHNFLSKDRLCRIDISSM